MLSNKTGHVKHRSPYTNTHTYTDVLDWTKQILNFWQIHLFQIMYNTTKKQKIKHTD